MYAWARLHQLSLGREIETIGKYGGNLQCKAHAEENVCSEIPGNRAEHHTLEPRNGTIKYSKP